jgi:hypothetical protein
MEAVVSGSGSGTSDVIGRLMEHAPENEASRQIGSSLINDRRPLKGDAAVKEPRHWSNTLPSIARCPI